MGGLIGPDDRKSVQPMAARYGQLLHFIAAVVGDSTPRENAILKSADILVWGENDFLLGDYGAAEEGAAIGRCCFSICLIARDERLARTPIAGRWWPCPSPGRGPGDGRPAAVLAGKLNEWPGPDDAAKVPMERQTIRAKAEIAIEEIDRIRKASAFACGLLMPAS